MKLFRTCSGSKANALVVAMIPVLVIMVMVTTYMSVSQANSRATSQQMSRLRALYAAESGIAAAIHDLNLENEGQPRSRRGNPSRRWRRSLRGPEGGKR